MSLFVKFIFGTSRLFPKRIFQHRPIRCSSFYMPTNAFDNFVSPKIRNCQREQKRRDENNNGKYIVTGSAVFFGLFGRDKEEDENPELIMNIKRCILLIQKEEYKKAEQMLHVTLREAQTLQNYDAVTYIYDLMANLAFEVGDYRKAESLFVSVMQRLISNGTPQDDIKIVHMSLKLAKAYEQRGDVSKAEDGYLFCQKILQKEIDRGTEDEDILLLWAMCMDWYARFLLSLSRHSESFQYFLKAYEVSLKINGEDHEQTAVLLNDLGTISFLKGDEDAAIGYLQHAADIGEKLPEMGDLAAIHVNLGNAFIKKGLQDVARKSCEKGLIIANKRGDRDSSTEAKACLEEINKLTSS